MQTVSKFIENKLKLSVNREKIKVARSSGVKFLGMTIVAVFSNNGRWSLSHKPAIERAYPNRWFTKTLGLKVVSNKDYHHWRSTKEWIKLT